MERRIYVSVPLDFNSYQLFFSLLCGREKKSIFVNDIYAMDKRNNDRYIYYKADEFGMIFVIKIPEFEYDGRCYKDWFINNGEIREEDIISFNEFLDTYCKKSLQFLVKKAKKVRKT